MTFGDRITARRKDLGLSRKELAAATGTSAPVVGRYERDEITPTVETAKKLADALSVTVDFLLGGSGQAQFDRDTIERMEQIEGMEAPDRSMVLRVLDALIRDTEVRRAYSKAPK